MGCLDLLCFLLLREQSILDGVLATESGLLLESDLFKTDSLQGCHFSAIVLFSLPVFENLKTFIRLLRVVPRYAGQVDVVGPFEDYGLPRLLQRRLLLGLQRQVSKSFRVLDYWVAHTSVLLEGCQ